MQQTHTHTYTHLPTLACISPTHAYTHNYILTQSHTVNKHTISTVHTHIITQYVNAKFTGSK